MLLESGYLSANDVHAFLTTWFVSPRGQIAFASRKLHPRSWRKNMAGAPRRCSGKAQVRGVEGEHAFPPNADRTGGADQQPDLLPLRASVQEALHGSQQALALRLGVFGVADHVASQRYELA